MSPVAALAPASRQLIGSRHLSVTRSSSSSTGGEATAAAAARAWLCIPRVPCVSPPASLPLPASLSDTSCHD